MISRGWLVGMAGVCAAGCGNSATVTLELRAHNALPPGLTQARFTVDQVTVAPAAGRPPFRHPAALLGTGGDTTFDLATLSGGTFAGEVDLPRVALGEVFMSFESQTPHPSALPLGPLALAGIFFDAARSPNAGPSDNIRLVIDFDSSTSVVSLPDGGFLFDPHATLEVLP